MGLDMYLNKRTYVQYWAHKGDDNYKITLTKANKPTNINIDKIKYIVEEVAYWRKANQIHNWFIQNCADGNSEKTSMYVSKKNLEELLATVNTVLNESKLTKGKVRNGQKATKDGWVDILEDGEYIKNNKLAKQLLPTQSGFFFGGTDYDKYYINDLKHTKMVLDEELQRHFEEFPEYEYSASW